MTGLHSALQAGTHPRLVRQARVGWQRGMVTVETALAVPALLIAGLCAAAVPGVVGGQIACGDAAREAALMIARDRPQSHATSVAASIAPGGADVVVTGRGRFVEVTVRATLNPFPGPFGAAVSVPVSASAVALREPGTP
jgi:Flp pilus assembly protein TadG